MAEPELYPPALTPILLTDRERRVIYRALTMAAAMMDALGDQLSAGTALELSERICPDEDNQ